MTQLMRISALVIAIALFGAAWLPAVAASSECDAQVDSELAREEPGEAGTHYTWRVEIRTDEDCATVEFQLILTIQPPDGDEQTVVRMGSVRLSGGSIQHQMRYEMKPDHELLKWEIVKSSCEVCVLDHPG